MDSSMTPYEEIQNAIKQKKNFVLQGGAGSGKTETLKITLEYISKNLPNKRAACITHTNLAAEEIAHRVTGEHYIGTIHSFLSDLIKDYKKNIKEIVSILFVLKKTNEYQKSEDEPEYKRYKNSHEKYKEKLYNLKKEKTLKCIGKREFDKSPKLYISELDNKIEELNQYIEKKIKSSHAQNIKYNESPFDNIDELSYGHDGLIKLAAILIKNHKKLRKIISDKYSFIFIDEYQDTSPLIIDAFLTKFNDKDSVFGLFGDSMQGIYEDGVGDVDKYINENLILKIKKPDNFRCSEQVIKFINRFRTDDLQQELALKKKNGSFEKNEDRQGAIRLYYLMNDNKPNLQSPTEEKLAYTNSIHTLIDAAKNDMNGSFRILMLTNKAIAEKAGFGGLYEIFAKRFGRNLKDQLEKTLTTLQFNEIFDLIKNDENSQHWMIIENAKKSGYRFENAKSKSIILSAISALKKQTLAANKAISKLISLKIISESNSRKSFISRCQLFLEELEENQEFQRFKQLYNSGFNTYAKFSKEDSSIDEYEFYDFERDHNKENFFQSLLSDKLELSEIISYFRYINEESEYITMHKTKGTGIKNTIVVFDEFFWPSYKFKDIFIESNLQYISDASKKILYVACSRTISNLFCVRIISSSEKADLDKFFETAIEVNT